MKNFANKLNNDSLNMVAGGTLSETRELLNAFIDMGWFGVGVGSAYSSLFPNASALAVEDMLNGIGIKADIFVGVYGFGSKANKYTDKETGRSLTHKEVLKRVKESNK